MVLESLITPITAEKKPWRMFFFGFLFSSLALVLSLWVFRTYASLLMVVFTVIACLPFIVRILKLEEEKDIKINDEIVLLKEHSKAIAVLTFLFLGMVISFALWFVVMPSSLTAEVYYSQMQTISSINTQVAANYVNSFETFTNILFNNLRVLSFCILFSFIYGAGAIFILTWNASVIGAAIGNFILLEQD